MEGNYLIPYICLYSPCDMKIVSNSPSDEAGNTEVNLLSLVAAMTTV